MSVQFLRVDYGDAGTRRSVASGRALGREVRSALKNLVLALDGVSEPDARIMLRLIERIEELEAARGSEAALAVIRRLRAILLAHEQ